MSANDAKRYYWWKKDTNFYDDHRIVALLETKNGIRDVYVYDRLCSESTKHNGIVRFSEKRAYSTSEVAAIVRLKTKQVEESLKSLVNNELIEVGDDGTIYIPDMPNRIGSETGAAERKRQYRGQLRDNVPKRLEIIDNREENKEKIIDYLSSSKVKYYELGMYKEFDNAELMMIKASQLSDNIPSRERVEDLLNTIIFKDDVGNAQGYLINCFKNER